LGGHFFGGGGSFFNRILNYEKVFKKRKPRMIFYIREFFVCDLYGFLDGEDQSGFSAVTLVLMTIISQGFLSIWFV